MHNRVFNPVLCVLRAPDAAPGKEDLPQLLNDGNMGGLGAGEKQPASSASRGYLFRCGYWGPAPDTVRSSWPPLWEIAGCGASYQALPGVQVGKGGILGTVFWGRFSWHICQREKPIWVETLPSGERQAHFASAAFDKGRRVGEASRFLPTSCRLRPIHFHSSFIRGRPHLGSVSCSVK